MDSKSKKFSRNTRFYKMINHHRPLDFPTTVSHLLDLFFPLLEIGIEIFVQGVRRCHEKIRLFLGIGRIPGSCHLFSLGRLVRIDILVKFATTSTVRFG